MAHIYLDESGDLGFDFKKKGTSRYFIVTLFFLSDGKGAIERIVRKTHAELSRSLKRRVGTLHAAHEKPITRRRLLRRIAEKDCLVMAVYLDKRKVCAKLHAEKQVLYNYVAAVLLDRIFAKKIVSPAGPITLIASRRETNKFLNEKFQDYLEGQMRNNRKQSLNVLIKTPAEEKALQAVDFLSWAMFRKYERGDGSYCDLFRDKIVEESPLFP